MWKRRTGLRARPIVLLFLALLPAALVSLDDAALRENAIVLATLAAAWYGARALVRANERLRALAARLMQSQEAERHSVAYELRDEICQALAAIKMNVQAAHNRAPSVHLQASLESADKILQRVRALSETLRPPQLVELGLEPAVRGYLERRGAETGLRIMFQARLDASRLPKALEVAAFRVIEESVENVIRHARANKAWVRLACRGDELYLEVADDGCGFDVESAGVAPGLADLEERVVSVGGRLELFSSRERGTEVRAWLPLRDRCGARAACTTE